MFPHENWVVVTRIHDCPIEFVSQPLGLKANGPGNDSNAPYLIGLSEGILDASSNAVIKDHHQ